MPAVSRHFHIRIKGEDLYWKKGKGGWGNWAQARLFTQAGVLGFLRFFAENPGVIPEKLGLDITLSDLEIVEYDILEKRNFDSVYFLNKYSKTPIIPI